MAGTVKDVRPGEGLRERHRRWTVAALEEVALRLFSERGFDAVTVEAIAAEAEIARRTFFRYFASKEDVLFSDYPGYLAELRDTLAARPAEEPALTALRQAFLSMAVAHEGERDRLLRRAAIVATSPALQAGALGRQLVWEQAVTEMVAERLGVDPAGDLRPGVIVTTTLAAMRVAGAAWLAGRGRAHLTALVAEAFDLLDGGLQQVSGRPLSPGTGRARPPSKAAGHAGEPGTAAPPTTGTPVGGKTRDPGTMAVVENGAL